jgi:hypothetical protein
MRRAAALSALLLATVLPAAAGPLYKCDTPKGAYYQNVPCPPNTRGSVVQSPTLMEQMSEGDPKTGSLTPEAGKLSQQVGQVVDVLATYPACSAADPAYAKAHDAQYERWKQKNTALIARIEADPRIKSSLAQGRIVEKKRAVGPEADRAKQKKECEGDVAKVIAGS